MEKLIKFGALCNQALGELYIDQRRYDDAVNCFQSSLRDWPGHGSAHRALAEICLRRGGPEQEAIEWARLSVQEERSVVDGMRIHAGGTKLRALAQHARDVNLGESLGNLAWALAGAGGRVMDAAASDSSLKDQVDAAVAEAVELTREGAVTSSALVHLHAGLAYAALGEPARAADYWKEASRIDPQGRCGRAALLALSTPATTTASR